MSTALKILLLIETSRAYGRKLLRGIAHYALLNGPWQFELQSPFYLPGSPKVGSVSLNNIAGFDGIIMREQKHIDGLIQSKIPIVFASYLTEDFDIPRIMTDDPGIAAMAVKYFLERGFKNYAFVGYDGMFWSDKRKAAFAQFVQEAGYFCHTYPQPKGKKWNQEKNFLSDWLRKLPKPTALLACNDDRAQQVLAACQTASLAVPEEIAILGIDNDEFVCTLSHPPLSSINLGLEIAGYEAASVLDRMIRGEKVSHRVIPVQADNIVTRQSTDILAIPDPVVAQAIQYIRKHIREPIQIEDVLNCVAISRRSLYAKFKQALGISPHRYIKKQRVEYIEHLLLDTEMTISQIAYRMGFQDDDHIAAYFRSVKGINPNKFRALRKLK